MSAMQEIRELQMIAEKVLRHPPGGARLVLWHSRTQIEYTNADGKPVTVAGDPRVFPGSGGLPDPLIVDGIGALYQTLDTAAYRRLAEAEQAVERARHALAEAERLLAAETELRAQTQAGLRAAVERAQAEKALP